MIILSFFVTLYMLLGDALYEVGLIAAAFLIAVTATAFFSKYITTKTAADEE